MNTSTAPSCRARITVNFVRQGIPAVSFPILILFNQCRLAEECFPDAETQKRTFDACREYARKCGFDGMIFAANIEGDVGRAVYEEYITRGYDFLFGYNSGYSPKVDYPPEEEIIEQQCGIFEKRLEVAPKGFVPTASCFFRCHTAHYGSVEKTRILPRYAGKNSI